MSLVAAVELACITAHSQVHSNVVPATVRVRNCPIWTLIKTTRWPERKTCSKLRDHDVVAIVLPTDSTDSWWLQCIRELITDLKNNGFSTNLAGGLAGAVVEMTDNVWQHRDIESPGLVVYQVRRRQFAFSVADTGIGVLASLRKNPRHRQLTSSMDAVRSAIEPGVSRFENGGGMGYPSLLHALADLWGTARIRSGEAGLIIDRTQHERKKNCCYLPWLPGVHVAVRCSLDPPKQSS